MNKDTMKLVEGGITYEAEQALTNLGHILNAADSHYGNGMQSQLFTLLYEDKGTI